VNDFLPPIISAIILQNPPITYNKTANVTCRVEEQPSAAGVSKVILSYHNGVSWNNVTMVRYSGDAYDGYYRALIPAIAYGITVQYWIWCNDSANNIRFDNNLTFYYRYRVNDFWGPSISGLSINTPITYNKTAIIQCLVQEPTVPQNAAGTQTTLLIYRTGVSWINITMNRFMGDPYNGQYQAFISPLPYGTTVQYWIWCNDTAGNPSWGNNGGSYYSYFVTDLWGPSIGTPTQNDTIVEYTDAVNISVQIMEPTLPANAAGIQTAILSYWTGSLWVNNTMQMSGSIYNARYWSVIPRQPYGIRVAYKIYAIDLANNPSVNNNNTKFFNYTVTDITRPTVKLTNPVNGSIISGYVPFDITDIAPPDADVVNITVVYRYNATPWKIYGAFIQGINLTWNPGSSATIYVNLTRWLPGTNYTIFILAQDLRKLVSLPSAIYGITVSNYTGPIVFNIIHTPSPVGYNESVTVSCRILVPTAYGGIDTVLLRYYNTTGWYSVLMQNTTPKIPGVTVIYTGGIPKFLLGTKVSYLIYANDTNGITIIRLQINGHRLFGVRG
jgi:hypothetical protein